MILAETIAVPAVDPIGLPAHPLIFVALLLLTQFLHLVFMNFVLGGSLVAVGLNVAAVRGHTTAGTIARTFYKMVPVTISMAITMAVAPLLFVQVLYAPYFYSSTVLMGFGWFSFFVAALIGFYLVYWLVFRGTQAEAAGQPLPDRPMRRLLISILATACFLWVGWIMANNHELSLHPALWRSPQFSGSRWYTPTSTTLARYLHDVVGATAISGLWFVAVGWWKSRQARRAGQPRDALSPALIQLGLKVALFATFAQIGTGLFFLLRLSPAMRDSLIGFTGVLNSVWAVAAILGLMALLPLLALAFLRPEQFRWFGLACLSAVVVVVGMLMGREHVRLASLGLGAPDSNAFTFDHWKVYPQNVSLVLFALLLVAGLAVVGVMIKWILQGQSPDTAK
jgi:hypothetical protein